MIKQLSDLEKEEEESNKFRSQQLASTATADNAAKSMLSRHVTSVISHFTSSKDGYRRLISEMDDFVHVVSLSGIVLFSSPSVTKFIDYGIDDVMNRPLIDFVHPDDRELVTQHIHAAARTFSEFLIFCRYVNRSGAHVLVELRGKPYVSSNDSSGAAQGSGPPPNVKLSPDSRQASLQPPTGESNSNHQASRTDSFANTSDSGSSPSGSGGSGGGSSSRKSNSAVSFIILVARRYQSKASESIDSIIDLRIQNLQLRRRLEKVLTDTGIDPSTHPLLHTDEAATTDAHDVVDEAERMEFFNFANGCGGEGEGDDSDDDHVTYLFGAPSNANAGPSSSAAGTVLSASIHLDPAKFE
eukprot:jgi/Hompol1/6346/HPOL_000885-RA